jgi:hypothetical protein
MREAVTDAQQRPGFPLRSLRSLQDGDENRGQLFALLSQRRELFHANNPPFDEQFKPVGALTRCFPSSSPATSRVLPSMSRLPNTLHSSISRRESPHFAMNWFARCPLALRYPRGFTVYVAYPSRSIQLCSARETLLDNWRRLKFRTGATASQAPAPPSSSGARKTCAQSEARKPSSDRVDPFLPSAFFLITSRCKPWQSPGSLLWFRLTLPLVHQ